MRNIKITIAYDGTRYNGWQRQDNTDNTIQGKLEVLLSKMTGENVEIHGSGRTDAGVHSLGQVFHFHTECRMTTEEIMAYMNEYLPMDIGVLEVRNASERFHSRLNVKRKTYCYHIWNSAVPNVFERKYAYTYTTPLNVEVMKKAASYLIGTHDFMAFCGNKKMKKSTVRTVFSIDIIEKQDEIVISYTGDGFLHNMIRIMTGTLIEVGNGTKQASEIPGILEGKNRELAGFTVPPEGLMLKQVDYAAVVSN